MPNLSEVLGAYVERRTDDAAGLVPLDGTASTVRHKRAVRQGVTAGASVLGLGALFAGVTVAARHYASIQPASYYLPEGGGTVAIAVDGPDPTIPDIGIACGDPAPVAAPTADGFTAALNQDHEPLVDDDWDYLDARVDVTNNNVEQFPAFVMDPAIVLFKDGEVVSIEGSDSLSERLFFTPGRIAIPRHFTVSGWRACGDEDHDRLPVGDYEYYVVITVANSPEIAALSRAGDVYGQGPWFNGDRWLEPTDWECNADTESSAFSHWSSGSAACLPRLRPEFTWDAEARTVTMPYSDGRVTRVFSTQLVAGPYPFAVTSASTFPDIPEPEVSYSADDLTAPCGGEMEWDERGSATEIVSTTMTAENLDAGKQVSAEVWVSFGPDGVEARTATLDMPGTSEALIFGDVNLVRGGYNIGTNAVVGRAKVTVNDGQDLVISRATGPARVFLDFEDVEWCGGVVPTSRLTVAVAAPLTMTADGTQEEAKWFMVQYYEVSP